MAGSEQSSSAARVPVGVEVFEMDSRELARKHGHHAAGLILEQQRCRLCRERDRSIGLSLKVAGSDQICDSGRYAGGNLGAGAVPAVQASNEGDEFVLVDR